MDNDENMSNDVVITISEGRIIVKGGVTKSVVLAESLLKPVIKMESSESIQSLAGCEDQVVSDEISSELDTLSGKREVRRYKTGRNQQLNLKVTPATADLFYQLADKFNVPLGELFERALTSFAQGIELDVSPVDKQ